MFNLKNLFARAMLALMLLTGAGAASAGPTYQVTIDTQGLSGIGQLDFAFLGLESAGAATAYLSNFSGDFGDFVLEGDAQLSAVAALYGLRLDDIDGSQPLGRFIAHEIGGEPVVGDQVEWNGLTWTVALMEGNKVRKVGVRFPEGHARPGPGLFL